MPRGTWHWGLQQLVLLRDAPVASQEASRAQEAFPGPQVSGTQTPSPAQPLAPSPCCVKWESSPSLPAGGQRGLHVCHVSTVLALR